MEFFSEALPKAELKMKAANEQILASPFVSDFEAEFGTLLIQNIRCAIRLADERNIDNRIKESRLDTAVRQGIGGLHDGISRGNG